MQSYQNKNDITEKLILVETKKITYERSQRIKNQILNNNLFIIVFFYDPTHLYNDYTND